MSDSPLISINIPTLNSEKTLAKTLESVKAQSYKNLEVLVIDNGSADNTTEIAQEFEAKVLINHGSLLESRCIGIGQSTGKFILLLDSDQILESDVIYRSFDLSMRQNVDYLFLEERAFDVRRLFQRLYNSDRTIVQSAERGGHEDYLAGNSLPRFFKASLIKRAIDHIPQSVKSSIVYRDHAVLYFEVGMLSDQFSWIDDAIYHNENTSMKSLLLKHFRYGIDDRLLSRSSRYADLVRRKRRGRLIISRRETLKDNLYSILLTVLKGIPYAVGYYAYSSPNDL